MGELDLLRVISYDVFKRPHQLEVAQAVAEASASFEAAEIVDAVRRRAIELDQNPPSESAARKNLARFASLRVVNHISATRKGQSDIWTREPGAFWEWLAELPKRLPV